MVYRDFRFVCDTEADQMLIKAGRRVYSIQAFVDAIQVFLTCKGYSGSKGSFPRRELQQMVAQSKPSTMSANEAPVLGQAFGFRFAFRYFMAAIYGPTLYRCACSSLPYYVSERRVKSRQRTLQRQLVSYLFGRTSLSTSLACYLTGSLPYGTSAFAVNIIPNRPS
jgi:hypothetical protein